VNLRAANLRTPSSRLIAGLSLLIVVPLAVLTRVGWHPLTSLDRRSDDSAHTFVLDHSWLLSASRALTHLGDPIVVTTLAVVAAVAMAVLARWRAAAYVLLVRAIALVIGDGLKEGIRRARPVLAHPVAHAHGFSFPSGHAVGAAALYASIAIVLGSRVPFSARLVLGVLPAFVVAATRVLLGVHFPSDVVAGLFAGWAVALLLAAAVRP
jgi:membrane-associated phospholipid phosphatase